MCIRDRDYTALAGALLSVGATYGLGILCAYSYNRIMVNVSQGTMRNLCLLYTSRCV